MHCNIVKLANQLGWQTGIIGYVTIHFSVSCGSNLKPLFRTCSVQSPFIKIHYNWIELLPISKLEESCAILIASKVDKIETTRSRVGTRVKKHLLAMTLREIDHTSSCSW